MTPAGLAQLKSDEGCRLTAYPDPISGGDPWTIGYGATGPGIVQGTVWTQQQADDDIVQRTQAIETQLGAAYGWFAALDPVRQDVLVNIAYNIGVVGLERWPITMGAVGNGDYAGAAADIRGNTVWANQVHGRCTRCADAMQNDAWGAPADPIGDLIGQAAGS